MKNNVVAGILSSEIIWRKALIGWISNELVQEYINQCNKDFSFDVFALLENAWQEEEFLDFIRATKILWVTDELLDIYLDVEKRDALSIAVAASIKSGYHLTLETRYKAARILASFSSVIQ
jgi:hypothetical protein